MENENTFFAEEKEDKEGKGEKENVNIVRQMTEQGKIELLSQLNHGRLRGATELPTNLCIKRIF